MDHDEPTAPLGDRSPLEGEVLNGRWRVVRLMARGEAGALFEGVHIETGDAVRIWVLLPRLAAIPEVLRRLSEELARIDQELGAVRWLDAASDEGSGVTYVVTDRVGEGDLVPEQFRSADDLRTALHALLAPAVWGSPAPAGSSGGPQGVSLDWLRERRLAAASAGVAPFAFAAATQPPAPAFEAPPAAAPPPMASPAPSYEAPRATPPPSAGPPPGRRRGPHPALWGSVAAIGVLVFGSTVALQSIGTRPTPVVGAPAPGSDIATAPNPDAAPNPSRLLNGGWALRGVDCERPTRLAVVDGRLIAQGAAGPITIGRIRSVDPAGAVIVGEPPGDLTTYRVTGDTLTVTSGQHPALVFTRCPATGAKPATANAMALGGEAALIAMALAGAAGPAPEPSPPPRDEVDVSAFAPKRLRAGRSALAQIYLHRVDQEAAAAERARAADPELMLRGQTTLGLELARSTRVDIMLDGGGLGVDEPIQSLIWRGRPAACQFVVAAPDDAAEGQHVLTARVLVGGVPLGRLAFTLAVDAAAAAEPPELTGDAARRYERAFLSYSSLDRPEVLKTAQTLQATGIDYFQDILSIEPGEAWRDRLFAEIDRCDLFLLFWSSHAAGSDWVRQEAEYALARHRGSAEAPPDIRPIILEGPPIPLPPASLASLHFNDMLRYVVVASELEAKARAGDRGGA